MQRSKVTHTNSGTHVRFGLAYMILICLSLFGTQATAEQPSVTPAGTVYKCKTSAGAYSYQGTPCLGKTKGVTSWATPEFALPKSSPVTPGGEALQQSQDGSYRVSGSANAIPTNFVVDTGATVLSIPRELADKAGLHCVREITTFTANGKAVGCETVIGKLTFGKFTLRDVRAVIMPNLAQPLLGMNVLGQFKVEHEEGTMKISTVATR